MNGRVVFTLAFVLSLWCLVKAIGTLVMLVVMP